jgi:hypothetical protein
MAEKNEYENFANKCYDSGKDLNEEMENEIASIIDEYKLHLYERDLHTQAKKIMRLIWATKYEW